MQSTLDGFFDVSSGTGPYAPRVRTGYASKRLQKVVEGFTGKKLIPGVIVNSDGEEVSESDEPAPLPAKRKSKAKGGSGKPKTKAKPRKKSKAAVIMEDDAEEEEEEVVVGTGTGSDDAEFVDRSTKPRPRARVSGSRARSISTVPGKVQRRAKSKVSAVAPKKSSALFHSESESASGSEFGNSPSAEEMIGEETDDEARLHRRALEADLSDSD